MNASTAPVAVLHSTSPATDTARVWVDSAEPDRAAIAAARKIACGALHTIVGKPLTVESAGDGASYVTFPAIRSRRTTTPEVITDPAPAPVKAGKAGKGKGKGKPAPTALDDAVGAAAFRAAVESPDVETLKRELDRITAQLAALTGGQAAPAPVKAPRAVPEFIARAQRSPAARAGTSRWCGASAPRRASRTAPRRAPTPPRPPVARSSARHTSGPARAPRRPGRPASGRGASRTTHRAPPPVTREAGRSRL
jgi:hypothetical protein